MTRHLSLIVAIVIVLSCGGSVEATAPAVQQDSFPDAYAHAVCDNLAPCCVSAGYEGAEEDCFESVRASLKEQADAARTSGAVYDPVAGTRCVEAWRTMTDECLTYKDPNPGLSACIHVFAGGDKRLGETCTAWECAGSATCYTTISRAGSESVCTESRVAKEGESCSSNLKVWCETGLLCLDGTCRPYHPVGDACLDGAMGDMCEIGATCDWDDTKQCVPARAFGEPCTDRMQCEGYACEDGKCVRTALAAGLCAGWP